MVPSGFRLLIACIPPYKCICSWRCCGLFSGINSFIFSLSNHLFWWNIGTPLCGMINTESYIINIYIFISTLKANALYIFISLPYLNFWTIAPLRYLCWNWHIFSKLYLNRIYSIRTIYHTRHPSFPPLISNIHDYYFSIINC